MVDDMNILEWALHYFDLGLTPIPVAYGTKRPLVEWKQYQRERPSREQIKDWFSGEKPLNIAIICGSASNNFIAIDFDDPQQYPRFFKREEIEAKTPIVKTHKGLHIYFINDRPVNTFKIPELGPLEVRGEGSIVVVPPSLHPKGSHYQFINDVREPMNVEDLEASVWKRAIELGVKKPFLENFGFGSFPCIDHILGGVEEGMRNEAAIRLASFFLNHKMFDRQTAWTRLRFWNGRNKPPLPDSELKNLMKSALKGYEYGCNGMKEAGFCRPDMEEACPAKNRMEIKTITLKKTPAGVLSDGRIFEEAYDGKEVFYLVYDPAADKVEKAKFLVDGQTRHEPIFNKDVETQQVYLPSDIEDYDNDESLAKEAMAFLDRWHEQNDRKERVLDVMMVFISYIQDLLPEIPYRRCLKAWGHGGSTYIESMGAICHRGFKVSGCSSEAALRRTFDLWRGTAIIDEADFKYSDLFAIVIKILNIGYSQSLGWYRCCDDKDPTNVLSFFVYCLKLLSTRDRFKDPATESRCLTFIGRENIHPVPLFRMTRFNQEAQHLRNKMTLWRFRNRPRMKELAQQLEIPETATEVYGPDSQVSSRIKQITLPICLVAPDLKEHVVKLAEDIDKKLKARDEERQLQEAVLQLIPKLAEEIEGAEGAQGADIWEGGVKISLKRISEEIIGEDAEPKTKAWMTRTIRKIFENRLGLIIRRGKARQLFVLVPTHLLREYPPSYTSAPSDISAPSRPPEPPEKLTPEPPPSFEDDLDLKFPRRREKLNLRFEKITFCHCELCGRASYDAYRCYGIVKDEATLVCGKCKKDLEEGKEAAGE